MQNVYLGDNTWQHVYGNDREVLTGDCQGGAYYGTLASVSLLRGAPEVWCVPFPLRV